MELIRVGGFRYNIRLYMRYIRINWLSAIEFRMGLITVIFQILMSIFVWYIYWSVLLDKTSGNFSGWTSVQLLIWYGLTEFAIGLLGLGSGLIVLIFIIHQDGLEQYLSKPTHVLVSASGDQMYVMSLLRLLYGLLVIISGMIYFDLYSLWYIIIISIIISIMGCVLIVAVYVIVVSMSFFLGRIYTIYMLLMDLEINLIRLPMHIFPPMIFLSLLFIYPIGLLATLPTLLIFHQMWFVNFNIFYELLLMISIIVMTIVISYLTLKIFNYSLRFYVPVGE